MNEMVTYARFKKNEPAVSLSKICIVVIVV
jgi:hypothetical protein